MALEFNCPSCGETIVVKYLGPGETAKCRNCGAEAEVPADALKDGEEPRYVRPKEKRESAGAGAAASLPSKEQAAQNALASFFIGIGGFLGYFSLFSFLWVFVAPYGIKLALRGKESENRTFAVIGLTLCIVGLVSYGIVLIAVFLLSILNIAYMPRR